MLHKANLRGLEVRDREGLVCGKVVDTYPCDGSGDPSFALVRLNGFGGTHFVPVAASVAHDGEMHVPWTKLEIEDAPSLDSHRHITDQAYAARSYWNVDELEMLQRLAVRGLASRFSALLKAA